MIKLTQDIKMNKFDDANIQTKSSSAIDRRLRPRCVFTSARERRFAPAAPHKGDESMNLAPAIRPILIVDDHSDIRRLLQVTLDHRYSLVEADDGASALEAVRHHQPRLVLLDVMMPGAIDGLDVLSEIKANPKTSGTLVAILSARGQIADQEEAQKRGADAYFIKPFSPAEIMAWVSNKLK
jgi:CheY-like chemotaxis protein